MKNRARWAGHPIHPILVTVPVAAFPVSLIFDLVFWLSGNPFWYVMAFWLLAIGVIGGLAAGIPGLIDYLTSVPTAAMPTARRHGLIGAGAVLWFLVDAAIRATGPMFGPRVAVAMAMSLIGVVAMGIGVRLGNSLVYTHRVGVAEPASPEAPPAPEIEERRAA